MFFTKQKEYTSICDKVEELLSNIKIYEKTQKDTTELYRQLGVELDKIMKIKSNKFF